MSAHAPEPAPSRWRIRHVPAKPAHRAEDGGVTVPLWLLRDNAHHCDLELTLTPSQAELLHAQLCYALATEPPPATGPDCRRAAQIAKGARQG